MLPSMLSLAEAPGLTLQEKIRRCIVDGAMTGLLPLGSPLPSSRSLAAQLGVSRNTVVLAYNHLIDDGFIESRPRRGLFLNKEIIEGHRRRATGEILSVGREDTPAWAEKLSERAGKDVLKGPPANWRQYPYPFIEGVFDDTLFPVAEWRETSRAALALKHIQDWSVDESDADDPQLIEEIRTKILPRRGICARPEEILITAGVQQALQITVQILADASSQAVIEEPGDPNLAELLRERGAGIAHLDVDDDGLQLADQLAKADIVFVTPSQQYPTGATLSLERRRALIDKAAAHDFVIVENDAGNEVLTGGELEHSLYGLDPNRRVVYIAPLSKVLTPGLRLGFMVGPAPFIAAARRQRRLSIRHPARVNQRAMAIFMSLGHYDTTVLRLARVFRERRSALIDALDFYLPDWISFSPARGGASYWVHGPQGFDAKRLAVEAERHGVLIETVEAYYSVQEPPRDVFRISVTGVPIDKIREGVIALAKLVQAQAKTAGEEKWPMDLVLSGRKLRSVMSGATVVYRTVYGAPCTIEINRDGTLNGLLGHANEETDTGVWRIKGDLWFRKWSNWAYSEEAGFHVAVKGDRLAWLTREGRVVGNALIV